MAVSLELPFPHSPAPTEAIEVADGVLWARLPLPFRLDHVNIYLIEDGAGFALLDTGIDNQPTRELWDQMLSGLLRGRPLTRVIASHCHPDHIGLAGWLCRRLDLELYASQTEYLDTLTIRLDPGALDAEPYRSFYLGHGLSESTTALLLGRGLHYLRMVSELPRTFNRLLAQETLEIGGRTFEVLTGGGHSSEQVDALLPRGRLHPVRRSGARQDFAQHQRRTDQSQRRSARGLFAVAPGAQT